MLIQEVIAGIKRYYGGIGFDGQTINDQTTRDQILYGDAAQVCTGIVTTCWASAAVIQEAKAKGANLIICHEALFWNHGDRTDWLADTKNETFLQKKALLDDGGIVVWRNHDYIHSGIPLDDGSYADGIFYGLIQELGWEAYADRSYHLEVLLNFPETTVSAIGKELIEKLKLNGAKVIGRLDTKVRKVLIYGHVVGDDNELIKRLEQEEIDLLITMELFDFTASEYVEDSSLLLANKAILTLGHFNTEEPGMKYMLDYLSEIVGTAIPTYFVQSGDMYHYLT